MTRWALFCGLQCLGGLHHQLVNHTTPTCMTSMTLSNKTLLQQGMHSTGQDDRHKDTSCDCPHLELQHEGYVGLIGLEAPSQDGTRAKQQGGTAHILGVVPVGMQHSTAQHSTAQHQESETSQSHQLRHAKLLISYHQHVRLVHS
jgi:hypothetical protein